VPPPGGLIKPLDGAPEIDEETLRARPRRRHDGPSSRSNRRCATAPKSLLAGRASDTALSAAVPHMASAPTPA